MLASGQPRPPPLSPVRKVALLILVLALAQHLPALLPAHVLLLLLLLLLRLRLRRRLLLLLLLLLLRLRLRLLLLLLLLRLLLLLLLLLQRICLLYTSPSPRDKRQSRMPSSA